MDGRKGLTFLFSSFANEALHLVQKPVFKEKQCVAQNKIHVKDTKLVAIGYST